MFSKLKLWYKNLRLPMISVDDMSEELNVMSNEFKIENLRECAMSNESTEVRFRKVAQICKWNLPCFNNHDRQIAHVALCYLKEVIVDHDLHIANMEAFDMGFSRIYLSHLEQGRIGGVPIDLSGFDEGEKET